MPRLYETAEVFGHFAYVARAAAATGRVGVTKTGDRVMTSGGMVVKIAGNLWARFGGSANDLVG